MKIGEDEFQRQVIQLARLKGWKVAHFRPAMNRRGQWSTPVQGDGAGFPDLIMVKDFVIVAELKVGKNKASDAQRDWLTRFERAGVPSHVWTPEDWDSIVEALSE